MAGDSRPRPRSCRPSAAILFLIVLFYLVFRTGWNLRFADPSLTLPQIVSSILVISYLVFFAREARAMFLLIYMVSFVFGMFHLRTRQIFGVAFLVLACHAVGDCAPLGSSARPPLICISNLCSGS